MAVNKPRGLFVTGTDTGVGKTLVAAALGRFLSCQGVDVGVMKPAETGVSDPSELGPDAELLRWSVNSAQPADEICPYRLKAPLAPAVAASEEQRRINYSELLEQGHALIDRHQFTIIEGSGGLMVPLAGGLLMADLAKELKLPLLVIARPGLGTINHTLLTLFSARALDISVAGYIINGMPGEPGQAEKKAPHSLASLTSEELLGVLGLVEGSDQEKVDALTKELAVLPTLHLLKRHLP